MKRIGKKRLELRASGCYVPLTEYQVTEVIKQLLQENKDLRNKIRNLTRQLDKEKG